MLREAVVRAVPEIDVSLIVLSGVVLPLSDATLRLAGRQVVLALSDATLRLRVDTSCAR